jgi:hypothetical protein
MTEELHEGDRVEAVRFCLDEGLRIWPIMGNGSHTGAWRVVRVTGQRDEDITELYRADQPGECHSEYPDATYGVNDNETMPPGTQGTVSHVTDVQVFVLWDNGARLAFTDRDVYRKL